MLGLGEVDGIEIKLPLHSIPLIFKPALHRCTTWLLQYCFRPPRIRRKN